MTSIEGCYVEGIGCFRHVCKSINVTAKATRRNETLLARRKRNALLEEENWRHDAARFVQRAFLKRRQRQQVRTGVGRLGRVATLTGKRIAMQRLSNWNTFMHQRRRQSFQHSRTRLELHLINQRQHHEKVAFVIQRLARAYLQNTKAATQIQNYARQFLRGRRRARTVEAASILIQELSNYHY